MMNKRGTKKLRKAFIVIAGIAGILLFGLIVMSIQSHLNSRFVRDEMRECSERIQEELDAFELYGDSIDFWVMSNHVSCLDMLDYMIGVNPQLADSEEYLRDMSSAIDAADVMIVDRSGNVLCSAAGSFRSLKDESFAPLFECFDTGEITRLYSSSEKPATGDVDAQESEVLTTVFFMRPLDEQRACVIYESGEMQKLLTGESSIWKYTLSNKVIGSEGFAFAWSAETGKLLYYPTDSLMSYLNMDVADLGLKTDRIRDREYMHAEVNGKKLYLYPVYLEKNHAWLVCAVPENELWQREEPARLLLWLIFGILAADTAYYSLLLLKEKESGSGAGSRKNFLSSLLFAACLSLRVPSMCRQSI